MCKLGNLLDFNGEVRLSCNLDGFGVAIIGALQITSEGDDTIGTLHLKQNG